MRFRFSSSFDYCYIVTVGKCLAKTDANMDSCLLYAKSFAKRCNLPVELLYQNEHGIRIHIRSFNS